MHTKNAPYEGIRIAVIGGGTGNSNILKGLKPYVGEGLTAVVNMVDDGGSTRELRDEHGALPPGDLRQCLVALSNRPDYWRALFNYRFSAGHLHAETGLKGHSLGNLIIAAAEDIVTQDGITGVHQSEGEPASKIVEAVRIVGEMLSITGRVIPVTCADRRLEIVTTDGQLIKGEHQAEITNIPSLRGARVGFDKSPTPIAPEAAVAIADSDVTVIAPGDLYTSIGPTLAAEGMREALQAAKKVVLISNIMNRARHTAGFTVADYAAEVERIVGGEFLDYVIYNNEDPDAALLSRYAQEGERQVGVDEAVLQAAHYRSLPKALLSRTHIAVDPRDALADTRSLIRHDSDQTARAIMAIAFDGNG